MGLLTDYLTKDPVTALGWQPPPGSTAAPLLLYPAYTYAVLDAPDGEEIGVAFVLIGFTTSPSPEAHAFRGQVRVSPATPDWLEIQGPVDQGRIILRRPDRDERAQGIKPVQDWLKAEPEATRDQGKARLAFWANIPPNCLAP